jgi:hypothetical protein
MLKGGSVNRRVHKALVCLFLIFSVLGLGMSFARMNPHNLSGIKGAPGFLSPDTVFFENFDGVSHGELPAGWDTLDLTSIAQDPYWHIDTYNAHAGSGNSWWCGVYDALPGWPPSSSPPGYGNYWYQWLNLDIDLTSATGTVNLIFDQQYDAEFSDPQPPFDTWDGMNVQVSTNGGLNWIVLIPMSGYPYSAIYGFNLHDVDTLPGYSGPLQNWERDTFNIISYIGQPVKIRWSFCADLYTSDEDGGYNSDGAWFIDNVCIKNTTGDTFFFDDVESGQLPEWTSEGGVDKVLPGNYWTVIDTISQNDGRPCSYSGPNSAYCGDSTSGAGNGTYRVSEHNGKGLQNALILPPVDLSATNSANLSFWKRAKGDGDGGYTYIDASTDVGLNWTELNFSNEFPSGGDWQYFTLDVSSVCNNPDVRFRIRAQTGTNSTNYLYLYVDDICITSSGTEVVLQNDDGDSRWYWRDMQPGEMGAAKLTPTFYPCKIKRAMIDFYAITGIGTGTYVLHIYKDQVGLPGIELLVPPDTFEAELTSYEQWITRDVSDADIKLDTDEIFWVAVEQVALEDSLVRLLSDFEPIPGINAIYTGSIWQLGFVGGDFMIRAAIDTTNLRIVEHDLGTYGSYGFNLLQNIPNPMHSNAVIEFLIPKTQHVCLNIYDVTGQLIRILKNEKMDAGSHQITWNGIDEQGKQVASGVYFYQLRTKENVLTCKLIIAH